MFGKISVFPISFPTHKADTSANTEINNAVKNKFLENDSVIKNTRTMFITIKETIVPENKFNLTLNLSISYKENKSIEIRVTEKKKSLE